jgi:DNA-binding NtrC family response regulator/predicted hydrocarbon binding protein
MRIEDINSYELLKVDQPNGAISFAGQRSILVDATAMGTLRADLVLHLGATAARAVLTRLGYVQGWRLAEALLPQLALESAEAWREAGGFALMLQGIHGVALSNPGPLSREGSTIVGSFEAEQHIAHLGISDEPTCWMVCGLQSGYLSRVSGQEIFVLEERCVGRGDAACHLLGRTRAEWGDTRADELRFFHTLHLKDWLDASLHQATDSLAKVEQKLADAKRAIARVAPGHLDAEGMVARSPGMRHVLDLARRVAKVDSTVLVSGESGVGKERIARFVHDESLRARGPFVAINCAAITESLLESELFGHARGAFTGAVQDRAGLFEAAHGGTLLLDEVGEMAPALQVKLLRALQEREIRRVGENKSRPVDARVIAATNQDLTGRIAAGLFRKDLYYRLNVVELRVPPLRERHEDILPLARVLLAEAAMRLKRPTSGLTPRAADQLLRYDWPGNVRELENAMERAVALAPESHLELEDLPEEVRRAAPTVATGGPVKALETIEREYILSVLARNDGNQTATARQLGIGTATLYRKLKAYGMIRARGERGPRS